MRREPTDHWRPTDDGPRTLSPDLIPTKGPFFAADDQSSEFPVGVGDAARTAIFVLVARGDPFVLWLTRDVRMNVASVGDAWEVTVQWRRGKARADSYACKQPFRNAEEIVRYTDALVTSAVGQLLQATARPSRGQA